MFKFSVQQSLRVKSLSFAMFRASFLHALSGKLHRTNFFHWLGIGRASWGQKIPHSHALPTHILNPDDGALSIAKRSLTGSLCCSRRGFTLRANPSMIHSRKKTCHPFPSIQMLYITDTNVRFSWRSKSVFFGSELRGIFNCNTAIRVQRLVTRK